MVTPLESSVVRIYSNSGKVIGAGFLVSQKHILTCAHVVASALSIAPTTSEMPTAEVSLDFPRIAVGVRHTAKVVFWRPVHPNPTTLEEFEEDIAALELGSPPPDAAQPVRLVTSEDLWGHPFRVFGFPEGQSNGVWASGALRGGIASGWVQLEDVKEPGYRLEKGFSGAPVWDEELQGVAGMAVAAEMNRPAVKGAFIIPTNRLVKAWSELHEQAIPSCPYRGLFAFREEDSRFFFGREKFTEQLVAAVQRQQLVAVIGPSGTGKSSVVFAGLISQLRSEQTWLIESFRPGERPFRNLASSLVPLLETQMSETDQLVEINKLATAFGQGNISLQDVVRRILEKHSTTRLLLVADQFEELYTLCRDGSERQEFLARLLEAVKHTPSFTLVLTLRADFLGYALSYRPFADALQNADVKLGPMNRQELQDAIAKPAQKQGVNMEQGLIERILDAVGEEPGNLPLLEFALTQLWKKQSNSKLTHAAYDAIGGVEKALSNHAEEVYGQLSDKEQHKQAQRIFIQLVRPGEGTADTRRQATRAEVGEENWGLVKRLADARLVVSDRKKNTGETEEETVEIVHEALIREWPRLRQWMKDDRAFRLWQERLRAAMLQWETSGKDKGALLRGVPLVEARRWWRERPDELQAEITFILASLNLRKQQQLLGGVAGLSIFLALALPGIQWWQQQLDRANRHALVEKISKIQLIPQTKDLTVSRLALTEEAVWMAIYDSKEGKGEGLGRYDLKSKTLTRYQAGQKSDTKDDRVTALLVEGKDIWIGVENQGVLHSKVDQVNFTNIFNTKGYISSLVRDRQNRLWIGTYEGLYQVSTKTAQSPINIDIQSKCPHFTSNSSQIEISQMTLAPNHSSLWIATSQGLIQWFFDEKEGAVKCYPPPNCYQSKDVLENVSNSNPNSLNSLYLDTNGSPWVGTENGYMKHLTTKGCWFSYNLIPRFTIHSITMLNNSFLLVGTDAGLFLSKKTFDESKPFIVQQAKIPISYAIHRGKDGHIWLGTKRGLLRSEQPLQP